jgi:hypothetical protein
MEIGQTYTFVQKDPTNYYHPMGFAYFPDGAHAGVDELEPSITQTEGNTCGETLTCPAPMYLLNGVPLGTYSNDESVGPLSIGEDNFGLDDYEPMFFHPIADWVGAGEFSIKLNFNDGDYDKDIFYFCHVSTVVRSFCGLHGLTVLSTGLFDFLPVCRQRLCVLPVISPPL